MNWITLILGLAPKVVEAIGKSVAAWKDRPKPAKGLSHQDAARINAITNKDYSDKANDSK